MDLPLRTLPEPHLFCFTPVVARAGLSVKHASAIFHAGTTTPRFERGIRFMRNGFRVRHTPHARRQTPLPRTTPLDSRFTEN